MKLQRIRLRTNQFSWLVLDNKCLPIKPIQQFLKYQNNIEHSPNTLRAYAEGERIMANTQPINQVFSEYITNEFKGTTYESDVWDCENLGLKNTLIHSMYKLNFTTISPLWLKYVKLVAKKFIKHILHTKQFSTATSCNSTIVRLGWFIMAHKPECTPENINKEFILAFLNYLSATNLAPNTKRLTVIHIRSFIETVVFEGWFPFSKKRIIFEKDMIPMKTSPIPRFIPESVMEQLVLHINLLPEDQVRALLVLIETSRRIS